MSEVEASVAKIIERYIAAVAARDIDAFMRLYDPWARIFDAWGQWSYEGNAAWQAAIKDWFSSHPADRFIVSFEDVNTVTSATLVAVSAIVTYAVHSAQGECLNSMQNRFSWVLRTDGHVHTIVHEHTSAPIDFQNQKAILRRASQY